MSERIFCTLCDTEVFLSDSARVVQQAGQRRVVIDGGRAHICLVGKQLSAALKKIDVAEVEEAAPDATEKGDRVDEIMEGFSG